MSDNDDLLVKKFTQHHDEVKGLLDKLIEEQNVARERLDRLDLEDSRRGGNGFSTKSLGEQVAEHPDIEDLRRKGRGSARIKLDGVKSTILASNVSGGMVRPDVVEPALLPRRRLRVRDLLSQGRTESSSVKYARMLSRSNSAAPVSEATTKPEQTLNFEIVTSEVQTIAAWLPASVQILSDAGQLRTVIDGELRFAVQYAEEIQLLYGDGSNENLFGLVPQATAFSPGFSTDAVQALDKLLQAKAQVEASEFEATGVVLNSLDWARLQALKNSQEDYLGQGPFGSDGQRVWGMDVVASNSMTVDKFLLGDFKRAGTIYDRQEPTIEVSTEHSDYFVRNLVAVRGEERLALAVSHPGALIYGDLGQVT